jgi:hypothetical protein
MLVSASWQDHLRQFFHHLQRFQTHRDEKPFAFGFLRVLRATRKILSDHAIARRPPVLTSNRRGDKNKITPAMTRPASRPSLNLGGNEAGARRW